MNRPERIIEEGVGIPAVSVRRSRRKLSVLYLSYDGMLEPLGTSQVFRYLERLSATSEISLISFEKADDWKNASARSAMHSKMHQAGIRWYPLRYHKSPSALATSFDLMHGLAVALWATVRHRVKIVHARSYVPSVIALVLKKCFRRKFIFDMRGFWADERVDGSLWPRDGALYRVTKSLEERFLRAADHIVTLTRASTIELRRFEVLKAEPKPITVIPTCADLVKFHPDVSRRQEPFVFGYVGSVGTWYLFEETLAFFRYLLERRPDARFLVVNRKDHELIRRMATTAGVPVERIELVSAAHDDVPTLVQQMHLGAALVRPCYSKIASAPTKMAEYLGCGVPCLGNTGVGDVAEILRDRRIGVVLESFGASSLQAAVEEALRLAEDPALPTRCELTAREVFSLEQGVAAYREIYESLRPNT